MNDEKKPLTMKLLSDEIEMLKDEIEALKRQINAFSPFSNLKNSIVFEADKTICCLEIMIFFGCPVEPELRT